MKAVNIKWDTDGNKAEFKRLLQEIVLPDWVDAEDDDMISDYLSDYTGYCHFGFDLVDD